MSPKADLSCRKTYKKWYYIIFYFKDELRYYVHSFYGRFGGHFEFDLDLSLEVNFTRLRWILNIRCPQLTPCLISKTCHQVHDCDEFPPRYDQYFHSYSNNTVQLHNCTTNFLFVTMVTDVRGECFC